MSTPATTTPPPSSPPPAPAQAATPPAAPATNPPAPAPAETQTIDPLMAKLSASFEQVLKKEEIDVDPETLTADGKPITPDVTGMTIGDRLALAVQEPPKPAETPGTTPGTTATPATEPPAPGTPTPPAAPAPHAAPTTQTPPTPPPIKVTRPKIDSVADQVAEMRKLLETKLETKAPGANATSSTTTPPPATNADAEYEATLPEENRATVELLRWAEGAHPEMKGKATEMLGYYRKLNEFLNDHPDDEDKLTEFVARNKPKVSEVTFRKLEMERIKEEAVSAAEEKLRAKTDKELAEMRDKLHQVETTPVVQRATDDFEMRFAQNGTLQDGTKRIDPAALTLIREKGLESARDEYPIETPILAQHVAAAREYLQVTTGLKKFNEADDLHSWLANFMFQKDQEMLAGPPEKLVREGKTFVPVWKMKEIVRTDPTKAANYWTFGVQDHLNLIEENAHRQVAAEYKKVEKVSKRLGLAPNTTVATPPASATTQNPPTPPKAATPTPPPAQTPASTTDEPAPRGGSTKAPGAAAASPAPNPNLAFLSKLTPAATQILGTG
ncbi:MAG: hypothetical protein L0Z50_26800 [Verrucomicrobiales bacterium]|nr:hypothetical protein [Verrucomicrobiales bacterium]